ncbi:sodium-dependent neutral amino acid transporter B(0)AT3-like isoform X1 [Crotalus tigris]|uniref:sodium-dependent neutral amino acid transporter B(0)AT3-like isoform X1 n=2 Tax=Crotalus tigris TaxID=88082 RepID=UPI00192F484B|nr:sodium-dependent neutral amino acid transporter B(0)AT3-like isoform X1 [Crotalus tigris]
MSEVSLDNTISEDENRPRWDNKMQYLLSCIGLAVGFGNVWRFPYLCQIYGGGAFLIPYVIAVVFEGIPVFHLELAIGQFLRKGSIGVWNHISPYLTGIGYACMMVSFIIGTYYNMIIAWVFWYLGNSFKEPLPWSICPQDSSKPELIKECDHSSESNYFWYRYTLNISTDITQTGPFLWWLIVSLASSWIIVYLCTIKGIKSTGKAIYITISFLYTVLTIFLVYGLTLPGASEGLTYLFTPDFTVLKNPRAWLDAGTQSLFSLSLALGGYTAYSSYNPQKNDCEKDSVIIATVNSLTSIYASITIFSILGFKATINYRDCLDSNIESLTTAFNLMEQSISRENYTLWLESLSQGAPSRVSGLKLKNCDLQYFLRKSVSGPGLAFITFTEVVTRMPGAQIWSILFFLMLSCLGLSSMFGLIQGILTPFTEIPLVTKYLRKEVSCGIICFASFLLGLLFTTRSGSYWLEVFDSYGGSLTLLIISLLELCSVVYVYGLKRFCDNVEWMTGRPVNLYWKASWQFISPVLMVSVFLSYLSIQRPSTYSAWNPSYEEFPAKQSKFYPRWVLLIAALVVVLPCICFPMGAICHFKQVLLKRKEKQALHPCESTQGN